MMLFTPRPHDLLWLKDGAWPEAIRENWVAQQWNNRLPLVVRRDVNSDGRIPIGVRGNTREQRAAGWIKVDTLTRRVAPEMLADRHALRNSPFIAQLPVQAALSLAEQHWAWQWGITGSTGYALATGIPVLHADSDLDLLIRAPDALPRDALLQWQAQLMTLPCRADTQVETPYGAFALNEWLRTGRVLLKTERGPRLTDSPWSSETP